MSSLKVPFGLDESDDLVFVENADKINCYYCPDCRSKLILRHGEQRAKHFSHPKGCLCTPESILHKAAKMIVKKAIEANANNDQIISMIFKCRCCPHDGDVIYKIPKRTFTKAELEYSVDDFRVDVIGLKGEKIKLGVEIFATHKVDEVKSNSLNIPWIEVDADEIVNHPSKFYWNVINHNLEIKDCIYCENYFDWFILPDLHHPYAEWYRKSIE